MKIYLLERTNRRRIWDSARKFVIIAPTEQDARHMASQQAGDEGPEVWWSGSTCTKIGHSTAEFKSSMRTVCKDYRHG